MFKLGPIWSSFHDDYHIEYGAKSFDFKAHFDYNYIGYNIIFRVWPFNSQYCEDVVKFYRTLSRYPISQKRFKKCFRDPLDPNIRPKTLIEFYKYTPSADFLGFLIGDDNFRDDIISQTMKTTKYSL